MVHIFMTKISIWTKNGSTLLGPIWCPDAVCRIKTVECADYEPFLSNRTATLEWRKLEKIRIFRKCQNMLKSAQIW